MTYEEVLSAARGRVGPYCRACPVCDGLACRNTMPGPGAKGLGAGAVRNYQKWQEICLNLDTICENRAVDTTLELFGRSFALPVFAAPVGAMKLHYGDLYDDAAYNRILVIEQALGSGDKTPSPSEKKNIPIARKSIVAKKYIKAGEELSEDNITVKRPGCGISPMRWLDVLGTKAIRDFEEDELIEL